MKRGPLRSFFFGARAGLLLALALVLIALPASGCGQLDRLKAIAGGQKTVITTMPPDVPANDNSTGPAISADGRFVAFESDATNLVAATSNGASGIYLKDLKSGKTILISSDSAGKPGNGDSAHPAISADGRFVTFDSAATNLVPGDTNDNCVQASGLSVNCTDVFLKDTKTGVTTRLSTGAGGAQADRGGSEPAISADGRFVVFESAATNLAPGDANGVTGIFLKDTRTGGISLISADASGNPGDGDSQHPAISADGRFVAFSSLSDNLAPGNSKGKMGVFVKDTKSGAVAIASTTAAGEPGGDDSGKHALSISADGRFVAFESAADNLVPGDTNGKLDVFVKDMQGGAIVRASTDAGGGQGSEDSYKSVSISADGRWVVFHSDSPDLVPGDTNGRPDIFLKDIKSGAITRLSTGTNGAQGNGDSDLAAISADGGFVVFDSTSANLIPGDSNGKDDIFLRDMHSGRVTLVSTSNADVR